MFQHSNRNNKIQNTESRDNRFTLIMNVILFEFQSVLLALKMWEEQFKFSKSELSLKLLTDHLLGDQCGNNR